MNRHQQWLDWLEDAAERALFLLLRSRGHLIEGVEHPDRERRGLPQVEGVKTPDLRFLEDGKEVCVEFIRLSESGQQTRVQAVMNRLASLLEAELGPAVKELNPHKVALFWRIGKLPKDEAVINAEVEAFMPLILDAAFALSLGESVELEARPSFVTSLELRCIPSERPGLTVSGLSDEQTPYLEGVAEGMADHLLQSAKVEQLRDCADARVVAIDRAIMKSADLLEAALSARESSIPPNWTAIYFVFDASEDRPASEVWRRRDRASLSRRPGRSSHRPPGS